MRRLLALLTCLASPLAAQTVVAPLAAQTVVSPLAAPTFGSPTHFTEQGGEAVYRGICAGCHMADGRGAAGAGRYPSLADNPNLAATQAMIVLLLHGHGGMPGFARSLSDQQIADVIGFVRTQFGHFDSAAVTAAQVAAAR